jgi:hypothetical protein
MMQIGSKVGIMCALVCQLATLFVLLMNLKGIILKSDNA